MSRVGLPARPTSAAPEPSRPTAPDDAPAAPVPDTPAPPAGWTPDAGRRGAQQADAVFSGDTLNRASGRSSQVLHEYARVISGDRRNPTSKVAQDAAATVAQLAGDEGAALATLSPPAQAQYAGVLAALGSADPVSRLAAQKLLLSGKLHEKDSRGQTTLETLARLADSSTALAPGLSRQALTSELVQELATPSAIRQAARNTCGPTTVAILVAMTQPAEYARLVAGLASPEGGVELAQGRLARVGGTLTDDGSGRTSVQRLLEPALMEYSNNQFKYDNAADAHTLGGVALVPGAIPAMVAKMLKGITGHQASANLSLVGSPERRHIDALEARTAAGAPVPVLLNYKQQGDVLPVYHWVLATKVGDQVSFINPWGRDEVMPRRDFDRRLSGLVIPG